MEMWTVQPSNKTKQERNILYQEMKYMIKNISITRRNFVFDDNYDGNCKDV
jgi:hypothetical protein